MANSEKFVQPSVPKFDGHYDFWSMTMENFLRSKEMWNLVEEGIPVAPIGTAPASEAQRKIVDESKLKDLKVKNYLFQAIDREILETIPAKSTSKAIWDSMKQKYQGSSKVKRAQLQALRREFELLFMKEGEKVDQFLGRTLTVVNKLKSNGETIEQSTVVSKILRSLTVKFNYVVCAIEESNDLSTLSIDELHGSLLVQEQRMQGYQEEEHVLKIAHDDRYYNNRGRGRGTFRGGRGRGRGRQPFNKALVECFKCHKLGHFQYECPELDKAANYVEEEKEMLLMSYEDSHQERSQEIWFLDSSCSNHMTGNKKWFSEMQENFHRTVKLGNNSRMSVVAKGSVRLVVDGITQVIYDVYYVPELTNNLLSIGQLQEKGLAILIQGGNCKVYHPQRGLIIETKMSGNRMFSLLASMPHKNPMCLQVEDESEKEVHMWHCRFGHLNQNGLRMLADKRMVIGLPVLKPSKQICTTCLIGKQHREAMPKQSQWRASKKLQLVHSDICGPIKPASHSDKRYILSFIDDLTRRTWIYFLNEKSEAFTTFQHYKVSVEKETGAFITCLRTDRGGEFTSNEFSEFCKAQGIKRQLTATVENKTPEEAWSNKKPAVDYFKIFGCVAHVHIPDQRRGKLDDKSKRCVFLGVSDESKAWRLYHPISKKIIVSKDVVFEEEKCWNWQKSNEETKDEVLDWGDEKEDNAPADRNEEPVEIHSNSSSDNSEISSSSSKSRSPSNSSPDGQSSDENAYVEGRGMRERRTPRWMEDYDTGAGLFDEESLSALVMVMENDPLSFEEAVKSKKMERSNVTRA